MKFFFIAVFSSFTMSAFSQVNPLLPDTNPPAGIPGYNLVWNDEFTVPGPPDKQNWTYEHGFVRNQEDQWYQKENAVCKESLLLLTARRENFANPGYKAGSKDWRSGRDSVHYTSASINTRGIHSWQYGRFEIRAKIPAVQGSWPAIWTLGIDQEWPSCGETDVMEYYGNSILANTAWGTSERYKARWNSVKTPYKSFTDKDPQWADKFHVWRLDWTPDYIKIYLDDQLLNTTDLSVTLNANGSNPFHQPHYILLNLAIGGQNGGDPSQTAFPLEYAIDYVRVYQLKN